MEGVRIRQFTTDEVSRNWHWCSRLLAPSLAFTPQTTSDDLRASLISGEMGLASIHTGGAAGLFIVHPGTFDGVFGLWVPYVVAFSRLRPKQWLRLMRGLAKWIEDNARDIGCREVRIGGRDWSRILPGYERFDDKPNRLKKVL